MNIFEEVESEVRSYCRSFPAVFTRSKNELIFDSENNSYIDFFAGAGALNYGHNNDKIKRRLLDYLEGDGIIHSLDMYTDSKESFLHHFNDIILKPKNLPYKVQFCGPTGTNANEAALKLCRKLTGRTNIFAFTGSFHGMTTGSLSITSGLDMRKGAGVPLQNVTFVPYPESPFNSNIDTIDYMESLILDDHSGVEKPAAIFLETIQAEGGIYICSDGFLKRIREFCDKYDILLVVDDVQVGCGRAGTFFSFESSGIVPDMVSLSKSISGFGLPMALLLIKKELDIWKPGEHNGTFRGHQLSIIGADAALDYWKTDDFKNGVAVKSGMIKSYIEKNILSLSDKLTYRGKGFVFGIDFSAVNDDISGAVAKECFKNRLIIERAGRKDSVLKLLPPLTSTEENLTAGLEIIKNAIVKNL